VLALVMLTSMAAVAVRCCDNKRCWLYQITPTSIVGDGVGRSKEGIVLDTFLVVVYLALLKYPS
jgi:hypothetical protein